DAQAWGGPIGRRVVCDPDPLRALRADHDRRAGGAGDSLRRLVTATVRYPARTLARVAPTAAAPERHGPQMVLIIVGCLAVCALTRLFPSTPTYDPWAWI